MSTAGRPDEEPAEDIVMLLRHAEKPLAAYSDRGIGVEGDPSKHSLTVHGWVRAGALIELLAPSHGQPRSGLCRPHSIYGCADEGKRSKRSIETVGPLAARLGLEVVTRFATGQEAALARELRTRPGSKLVAWHHHALPKLASQLGDATPTPPSTWPGDRYDLIWSFTRRGSGWSFAQIPQLVLPGDLPHPIVDR